MGRVGCALLGALMGCMLRFPQRAAQAAGEALAMWGKQVLPALFPMLICMLLCTSRMSGPIWLYVLPGWLMGSPGGARICASLPCSQMTQKRLAALGGTMSPMFLLQVLPGYLGNPAAGVPLLCCHLGGAALTGLLLFPFGREKGRAAAPTPLSLTEAIWEGAKAMVTVCGCILLGHMSASMLRCACPFLPAYGIMLLHCLLEVTGGMHALARTALPMQLKMLFCTGAAAFGGLAILMQNAAFWKKGGVKIGSLLLYRVCHSLFSVCLLVLWFALTGRSGG